ncbi:hypothetical protein FRC17_002703 [Serendipita sp. 399]|nr:hypothetical protein FRC17_002703 [Serendipita sp. 399]
MSSRPVTPANQSSHLHSQSQSHPTRRNPPRAASNARAHQLPPSHPNTAGPTGSSTQTTQTTDNIGGAGMLATAHFQGHHVQYAQPPHSIFEIPHHDQPMVSSLQESMFALPAASSYLNPSVDNPAVPSVSYAAVTSGDLEPRRTTTSTIAASGSTANHDPQHDARPISSQTNPTSEQHSGQEDVPSTAPPRKKRTRTLTTAHQSSVLLALLARTPFPTTAEREEVGRAIGLTARKVQVWFQNQRQKQKKAVQTGTLVSSHHTATTSAPLPLSRQPGFSAHHAARMGVSVGPANANPSPPTPSTAPSAGPPTSAYSHFSMTPTTHLPEYHPSSSSFGHGHVDHSTYYPFQPARSIEPKPYGQNTSTPSSRPQTSHSHTVSNYANPGAYVDPYGQVPPRSAGGRSFGQGSTSHAHSLSDEYSLPPPSEASGHFGGSPSDVWRYKPLPPLPPTAHATNITTTTTSTTTARPSSSRGRSVNWEHGSNNEHRELRTFRSQQLSRSRAFSNPGTTPTTVPTTGYEPFAHVRPLTGTVPSPPHAFGGPPPPQYQSSPPLVPNVDSRAPSSYHGAVEYQQHSDPNLAPALSTGGTAATATGGRGEGLYTLRFGDTQLHRSPVEAPSTSPSYLGGNRAITGSSPVSQTQQQQQQQQQQQHPPSSTGISSYSPVLERRRNRLSYDSSLTSPSLLGKRSWSVDEEQVTSKRARTDDGHRMVTMPMGATAAMSANAPAPLHPPPTPAGNAAAPPPLLPISHRNTPPYLISPQTPLSSHPLSSHGAPPNFQHHRHHLRQPQSDSSQGITHAEATHIQPQHQT